MPKPRNVVLVVMDTTRVDDAYDPSVAPTLADLGDTGTRATRAFSTAPWTLPAHASLFTGMHPSRHGAHADHERLEEDIPHLATPFSEAGFETVCLSNNTWISVDGGFDPGFDTFRQMWQAFQSRTTLGELVEVTEESRLKAVAKEVFHGNPLVNLANALYQLLVRNRGDDGAVRTVQWVNDWLASRSTADPFFLFINFLEPHLDYRPQQRFAEPHLPSGVSYDEALDVPQDPWNYLAGNLTLTEEEFRALRGLYRGEISYLDRQLRDLVASLKRHDQWDDTLLVVLADHGENIGDFGMMDHQYCLYDTLTHVPLVLHGGDFTPGDDITDLVSLVDIAPTLMDAMDITDPAMDAGIQGMSFYPSKPSPDREYVISEYMAPMPTMDALERHIGALPPEVTTFDRSLRSIRTETHKLVRESDGSRRLYDVADGAGERSDISAAEPAIVDRLEGKLDEWLDSFEQASTDGTVVIDGNRKQQLERLGYLQ